MYHTGQGVQQDYAEAAKWYRKAAVQGVAAAQYNLGLMYTNGHGVTQDYAEAVKWYRKAAAQLRAHRQGGVTSVSAVIRDLVDANIDELRAEAKPLLDIG